MNATTTCSYSNPVIDLAGVLEPVASDTNDTELPFSYASATCETSYGYSSSSDASVANGFYYGDVVNSVLLFLLLSCAITLTYFFHFRKVRIKN